MRLPCLRLSRFAAVLLATLLVLSGCGYFSRREPLAEPVGLLAVLPVLAVETSLKGEEGPPRLAAGAENVVTAQIYGTLVESPRWRFVPDITVSDALRTSGRHGTPAEQAVALGRAVKADTVLTGTVSRFVNRVGSEYGAISPASVAFTLELVSVGSGKTLWTGEFAKTQEALSSNLFDWWMFWRAGPRWMTADELVRTGVERLLDDLDRRMPEG